MKEYVKEIATKHETLLELCKRLNITRYNSVKVINHSTNRYCMIYKEDLRSFGVKAIPGLNYNVIEASWSKYDLEVMI